MGFRLERSKGDKFVFRAGRNGGGVWYILICSVSKVFGFRYGREDRVCGLVGDGRFCGIGFGN